jgi:hypothetical protein
MRGPTRVTARPLTAIGRAALYADLTPLAQRIAQRIRQNRHAGGGSYLLADAAGQVYVLCDISGTTSTALADHPDWLAGFYTAVPEVAQVISDLTQAFLDNGFLPVEVIYEAIRMEEG